MEGVETYDRRAAGLVSASSRLEVLASGCVWCEGPVWMKEDGSVLWSDIPNNRMMRWHPDAGASVWRDQVEFTNGHTRERDGALLHCSHGRRAIVRTRFSQGLVPAEDEIVVERYRGKRLNSPNDVVVKSDGTIWFTDPPYGILSDHEGHKAESELEANHVFCFDPATGELTAASDFVEEPNGLAFSPDESVLYVSDTSAALRSDGTGNHHIVAFDVREGRRLENPRVLAEINPGLSDGFRVDTQGWIYTSSADSVQVYAPDGRRLMKIGRALFSGVLTGVADTSALHTAAPGQEAHAPRVLPSATDVALRRIPRSVCRKHRTGYSRVRVWHLNF